MIRSFEKLRHGWFSDAINLNVVKEPVWRARLNNAFLCWAFRQPVPRPAIPDRLGYEHPDQNPRTQRYWENRPILYESPAGTDPWLIELARVTIPYASIGILKSFEQVVILTDEGEFCFSGSANWGHPFVLPDWLTITWHFRLERVTGTEPALINQSGLNVEALLPGEPHFDLAIMDNIWFPASSPASQNIHLTIGGRYRFRVLALVERDEEYTISIAAKIRGFRLSAFDAFTVLPVRSIW